LNTDKKSFLIGYSAKIHNIVFEFIKNKSEIIIDSEFRNDLKIKLQGKPFQLFDLETDKFDLKENMIELILKYKTKIKNIFVDYYECGSILAFKNPNKNNISKLIILFM